MHMSQGGTSVQGNRDDRVSVVNQGTDVVFVEAAATYRAPARFDEEIEVELAIARLGTTSMTTHTAVRGPTQVLA